MVWQFWFALTPVVQCTEIKSRACRGNIQICIITTENRGREGGKLSALQTITYFGSCHLVHFDDSDEVLDELERYREYRGWPVGNPVGITAVGIKVPRNSWTRIPSVDDWQSSSLPDAQSDLVESCDPMQRRVEG